MIDQIAAPDQIEMVKKDLLRKAFQLACTSKAMAELYEDNFKQVSKYVHSTSRGHEILQIALGLQLLPQDFVFPYYRDEAMLLAIGMRPYELMLQLFAKKDDPFSGGRTYYAHPSLKQPDKPKIPHQSSATGMQAIPATGAAMGLAYKEKVGIANWDSENPIVMCSFGDASITEGEVAEAFQMAALHQLPILFLVQDNEWDISASADEIRAQNAFEYIKGFKGIEARSIDGTDFETCFATFEEVIQNIRINRKPYLIHARVPLLNHHTSGVRKEWYRDDLEADQLEDPFPKIKKLLESQGFESFELEAMEANAIQIVKEDYASALTAEDPSPADLFSHDFVPTPILSESGTRVGSKPKEIMVDQALHAIEELMANDKTCLLYGQDVGKRLGGVFREAATLAEKFNIQNGNSSNGLNRVFNTPIQEAFIVGSTVGMSAVGLKPIVEVQFADYIWPGLNQLFTEVSRSCYLTNGKWPVSMILRVPIGAYGSGGPYHSSSIESVLTNIRGIKIAYPSTGADLKGLLKAAFYDPNPVVMLEHKGLYWSKNPGTEKAKCIEPEADYILPFGKGRIVLEADPEHVESGNAICIITYGMGVYWASQAAQNFHGQVEVVDLRTLFPLDENLVFETVRKVGRCLVLTEEPIGNSFSRSLAGLISEKCFQFLDAPVITFGSENLPAIPLNSTLEATMLPNAEKVSHQIKYLLEY